MGPQGTTRATANDHHSSIMAVPTVPFFPVSTSAPARGNPGVGFTPSPAFRRGWEWYASLLIIVRTDRQTAGRSACQHFRSVRAPSLKGHYTSVPCSQLVWSVRESTSLPVHSDRIKGCL
jgi:hypothetical protein